MDQMPKVVKPNLETINKIISLTYSNLPIPWENLFIPEELYEKSLNKEFYVRLPPTPEWQMSYGNTLVQDSGGAFEKPHSSFLNSF
jgi:hypothetical protein